MVEPLAFVAVAVAALLAAGAAWEKRRTRRRAVVRPKIGDVASGELARMIGRVRAREVLTAPLTGRPCVFVEVVARERFGGLDVVPATIRGEARVMLRQGVPFLVDDGSGRALVDPMADHVLMTLVKSTAEATGSLGEDDDDDELAGLRAWLPAECVDGTRLQVRETILTPEVRVELFGRGEVEPDPDAVDQSGYRDAAPTRLRMHGSVDVPLRVSDDLPPVPIRPRPRFLTPV